MYIPFVANIRLHELGVDLEIWTLGESGSHQNPAWSADRMPGPGVATTALTAQTAVADTHR